MTVCMHTTPPPETFPGKIHQHWRDTLAAKGFHLCRRVNDRLHLEIRCHKCGKTHLSRVFTVMNHQPVCPHCIEAHLRRDAQAAGLVWHGRCPDNRHYCYYIAKCGHKLRRQHELIKRAARGECSVRCEICHTRKEEREATVRGWELIGPDPEGAANYRLYRHLSCGHVQRIARANMQSNRHVCGGCGDGWANAPSSLYLARLHLENGARLIKLGHSRDPHSRLHWQLLQGTRTEGEIVFTVPVATGREAQSRERTLHAQLRTRWPEGVAPRHLFAGSINVGSEVYFGELEHEITRLLIQHR